MTLFARHVSLICLLGFACLIVNTAARAQSPDGARKRAFAELLARKAKALHAAESRRETAAADRTAGRTAGTTSLARWTPVLNRIEASATGVSSASPLVPSGFGAGRDAFVDALYPGILGREATQSEEDYWSGVLAGGVNPNVVATLIWRSQEHRTELRTHTSPGVPYNIAYRYALFIGDKVGHP
jgi:Domain of unknown function (DUF4214)